DARFPVTHFHPSIEDGEDLLTIVDVPFVGRICPVEAGGDASHVGDVCSAPRTICLEGAASEYFHAVSDQWLSCAQVEVVPSVLSGKSTLTPILVSSRCACPATPALTWGDRTVHSTWRPGLHLP